VVPPEEKRPERVAQMYDQMSSLEREVQEMAAKMAAMEARLTEQRETILKMEQAGESEKKISGIRQELMNTLEAQQPDAVGSSSNGNGKKGTAADNSNN